MKIVGLEGLTYGVDDVATCRRFNEDLGLRPVEHGATGALFGTTEGSTVELREAGDADLPPAVVPGSTVRQIVWGVESDAVLEAIAGELVKDREVTHGSNRTIWSTDPMGYAIGFRVSTVETVVLEEAEVNKLGSAKRINKRYNFPERAEILHLGHVVFYTPNLEETYAFYRDRLGFRLTDTFPGLGYFMRCSGSSDHHNIFLLHRGDMAGLNHTSYAVRDVDEMMMGGEHMERQGWDSLTGPGRHVIGSNYFWYFHSPCGGAVETYADMDYLTDDWQPGEWEFRPEIVAAWDRGPGFG